MANHFFTQEQKDSIVNAVKDAELQTSGEIRVHIDKRCKENVLDMSAFIFKKLEMHKTELRNGVLFYIAYKDKKFAILGDAGINAKVEEHFWDNIKEEMGKFFKAEDFTKGLTKGISMAGEKLKKYFPYMEGEDINELPDDISFGNN
ncbi:MAG: TPM domain-containing protein [Bacteroidota bacterium]|nr:TPM domain-containing protein [Bacteroidota bacterium]